MAGWLGVARLVVGPLGIGLVILVARRLQPEEFGTWQFATAVGAYLAVFSAFGSSQIGTWRVSTNPGRARPTIKRWRHAIAITSAVVLIAWAPIPFVLTHGVVDRVLLLLVPAAALVRGLWPDWLVQGLRQGPALALLVTVYPVAVLASLAVVVGGSNDAWLVGVVQLTVAAVGAGLTWTFVLRALRAKGGRPSPQRSPALGAWFRASASLGLAALLIQIVVNADVLLMGILRSRLDTAHYAAAISFFMFLNGSAAVFQMAVFPSLSAAVARRQGAGPLVRSLLPLVAGVAIPVTVIVWNCADILVEAAYGPAYREASGPLRVLAVQALIGSVGAFFGSALLASGRRREYATAYALAAAVNVSLNAVAIPVAGPIGAAFVAVATELVLVSHFMLRARLPHALDFSKLGTIGGAACAMLLAEFIFRALPPTIVAVIGLTAYGLVVAMALGRKHRRRQKSEAQ
jgi:O-antigen/teichoic acid export membrane protein